MTSPELAITEKQITHGHDDGRRIRDQFPSPDIDKADKLQKLDDLVGAPGAVARLCVRGGPDPRPQLRQVARLTS